MSRRNRMVHQSDPNTPTIVGALEALGASVQYLGGKGVPDLLVGYQLRNYLMEVKAPKKELNGNQDEWHSRWKGQVAVVRTVADAFGVLGIDVEELEAAKPRKEDSDAGEVRDAGAPRQR